MCGGVRIKSGVEYKEAKEKGAGSIEQGRNLCVNVVCVLHVPLSLCGILLSASDIWI